MLIQFNGLYLYFLFEDDMKCPIKDGLKQL